MQNLKNRRHIDDEHWSGATMSGGGQSVRRGENRQSTIANSSNSLASSLGLSNGGEYGS
jgi:hypothetical protein